MVDVYCVVWQDAQGGSNVGWRDLDELKSSKLATAVSIGFLLHKDTKKVIICPHVLLENGKITQGDAEIVIPTAWVNSITKLYKRGGDLVPKVGNVKYPYTQKGMRQAQRAAKRTGQRVKKTGSR